MDNPNAPQNKQPQPAPHQQASLIRVEQVKKLPHLNDQQKASHEQMVKRFWDMINNNQPGTPEYVQAYQQLSRLSSVLMQAMKAFQAKRQTQPQGQGQSQSQSQGPAGQPQPRTAQPAGSTVSFTQLNPEIQQRVNATKFFFPPAMMEGTKPADDWLREAKARYGHALQRSEMAKQKKSDIERQATQRSQAGNPLNPQEQEVFNAKIGQCMKAIQESESFMLKFREQQAQFQKSQPQHKYTNSTGLSDVPEGISQGVPATGVQGPTAHSISSAVSAARNHAVATQATSPPPSQSQLVANSTPTQPTPSNMMQSPHPSQTPQMENLNGQSRMMPNMIPVPGPSQTHPASATHAHPQNYLNPAKKDDRQPITKSLQVTSPKPIPIPPARPTLSGGPNGMPGQMAMPAIPQYPGYVLESSEDGRLLSKKKLNELVREVCGPGADEQLTPEVEEIFLQITDDFVDDLISAACKLARLRGSQQLESRDIQVVLERQYNIRIPGYSTDEIRTVRRPQPAAGWAHKMSAVQAAKLTGGATGAAGVGAGKD